jgi:D-proline reductase (dithiol) PrdB
VTNPSVWPGPRDWRLDYNNIERLDAGELARLRAENDQIKRVAQAVRDSEAKA